MMDEHYVCFPWPWSPLSVCLWLFLRNRMLNSMNLSAKPIKLSWSQERCEKEQDDYVACICRNWTQGWHPCRQNSVPDGRKGFVLPQLCWGYSADPFFLVEPLNCFFYKKLSRNRSNILGLSASELEHFASESFSLKVYGYFTSKLLLTPASWP